MVLGGIYCPYLVGSLAVVWQLVIHGAINGAVADDAYEDRTPLAALCFAEVADSSSVRSFRVESCSSHVNWFSGPQNTGLAYESGIAGPQTVD